MASALDNDDVLTEILLRLPAKSLMRFKSICRKWLSLVSSDYFCHQHFLRHSKSKSQPSLILQYWYFGSDPDYFYWSPTSMNGCEKVTMPYTLSPSAFPHNYKILQACNGLLLLKSGIDSYLVYNPTTKLSTDINIPTYNDECECIAAVGLAFDPSKSPYYKIVCIICSSKLGDDTCRIEVYDSESCSWKLCFEPFTLPWVLMYSALYWNNAIYWWYPYLDNYYCFDIATNEMKAFSFPKSHLGKVLHSYLQELDGRLYYLTLAFFEAVLETGSHELLVAVWELGDNWEWLLKHYDDHLYNSEGIGRCVRLMGHDSDGSLQMIHYHSRKMKMKAYNFVHKRSEDLVDFTAPPFDYKYDNESIYLLEAFQFRETLASV